MINVYFFFFENIKLGFFDESNPLPKSVDPKKVSDLCWDLLNKRISTAYLPSYLPEKHSQTTEQNKTILDEDLPVLSLFMLENFEKLLAHELGEHNNALVIRNRLHLHKNYSTSAPHELMVKKIIFLFRLT